MYLFDLPCYCCCQLYGGLATTSSALELDTNCEFDDVITLDEVDDDVKKLDKVTDDFIKLDKAVGGDGSWLAEVFIVVDTTDTNCKGTFVEPLLKRSI